MKNNEKFEVNRVLCDVTTTADISVTSDSQKTVIRLDKNFHVYKHGSNKLIERGYSKKKKMKFIKLYYNEEL